tara:strand:- start:585 stop:1001 length:417 start_codon:yes stop_codon:yes gene_type:complete
MAREDIVSQIETFLKEMKAPKLGKVQRDPIDPNELPKTAFPAVFLETTDEDIEDVSLDSLRRGEMLVNVIAVIGGKDRDRQRNILVDAVEKKLLADRTVNNTATHIALTGVESVQLGESAPYASIRMVFNVKHHYKLT